MPRLKKVKVLAPKEFTKVDDLFAISVRLRDRTFKGEGETMLDALTNLEKPSKITHNGIVTISHGDKVSKELLMNIPKVKRLYFPMARFHLAKTLGLFVK